MIKNRVTQLLGIEYPILGGPMAYISKAELVSAISNAGGLGILPSATYPSTDDLKAEIRKIKSLTSKPFAVNVTLLPTTRPVRYEDYIAAAFEEGVRIFETSGRSPEPYMKMLKDGGAITMHRSTRTRDVKTAERLGVDIATIIGYEAAAHTGIEDIGSLVRIAAASDAVQIPVVAAGGIADARGFVAALALGAEGVLMGTRFLTCKEAPVHPSVKEWLAGLDEKGTMVIQRSIKNEARVARTEFTENILAMEQKGCTLEDLLPLIAGRRGQLAYETGDYSACAISAGQCLGVIHDVLSAKEIIDGMISGAHEVMRNLGRMGLSN
ncbi:MAG: nitronate monooxygenase [Chloroflexi bacterium]|nr:nitronate monooxygenase [Chloroflexota bacterium]